MTGLTKRQRTALKAIAWAPNPGVDPGYVAAVLKTSRYGATMTVASLVRRGLVLRHYLSDGTTRYLASDAGREMVA